MAAKKLNHGAIKLKQKRYKLDKNKHLTDLELELFENTLLKHQDESPRDTLVLELLLRTGARASEILDLRLSDIDADDQAIYLRGLKGSDDRVMPLRRSLFQRLITYARDRGLTQDESIFPISLRRLEQIWSHYRPAKKKLHCLRHTFGLVQFKASKNLHAVKTALGHRNINNTLVYVSYIESANELRKNLKI